MKEKKLSKKLNQMKKLGVHYVIQPWFFERVGTEASMDVLDTLDVEGQGKSML